MQVTVLVDAENVRRSTWPNVSPEELVELCGAWADAHGHRVVVVFDGQAPPGGVSTGAESADDWIARWAAEPEGPYWLVTSDRELRDRAGDRAQRTIGGGSFVRELRGQAPSERGGKAPPANGPSGP